MDFTALRNAAAGLVFNECSGWGSCGWGSADVGERLVSGRSMVSPGRHQARRCKRMPWSSWWRGGPAGHVPRAVSWAGRFRMPGGHLKPTDKAMAARSDRTSSSEDGRSIDEEERMLTKRCAEWQWKKQFAWKTPFFYNETAHTVNFYLGSRQ